MACFSKSVLLGAALILNSILCAEGKNGEVVLSGTRSGVAPSAKQEFALFDGKATIGGEYDYEVAKNKPKSLSLGYKEMIKGVPTNARLLWNGDKPNLEVSVGSGDKGQPKVVLDSTAIQAGDKQVKNLIKTVQYKITRFSGLVLEPKFKPEEFSTKTKGLEVDLKANLNTDRAYVKGTIAPNTRPKLTFSFKIADDLKLDLQPLLGSDGTKTKLELEKEITSRIRNNAASKLIQTGTKLSASILENTLSLAATLPDNLGGVQGNLKPSISVDITQPTNTVAFKLAQSFDI